MNRSKVWSRRRRGLSREERRAQLLEAFDRSGLSAAAFARQHGLPYSTLCHWRYRRAKIKSPPAFVEVEVPATTAPVGLVIELGVQARMRLNSPGQIELAARLIASLNPKPAC